ncbi:hypothetical protein FIBSPDRAFT_687698, partial [Athelia psychrophila]
ILARSLQSGYTLSPSSRGFSPSEFTPLSLSDIARHNGIVHDTSLVLRNAPLGDEYASDEIDAMLVEDMVRDGIQGWLMNAENFAKARVHCEHESPTMDGLHVDIARG